MAFELQIHVDSVFDSVFQGIQHLNWMDKITSHIIQMDLNPQSLNSKVSDIRVSDSEVSEASNTWVLKVSYSRASEASNRVLGLGFETQFQRLGA